MENTQVAEPVVAPAEPVVTAPAEPQIQDPFALDEARLISLSPEQRGALDPIIQEWKKRASDEITKRESGVEEKYKPMKDKAMALEKLTQYQPFVQWWNTQQNQAAGQNPGQQTAIAQTKPADFATSQEWQEALYDAAQGDGSKLQNIQSRMMAAWATPFVQQITHKQQYIETQMEMNDLFSRHPDAKQLDEIGIDPKTKEGISLLEMGLDWAEKNKKPLEEGYNLAKRWSDQMSVSSQKTAMGLVQSKKQDVTAGNSTANGTSPNIIVVDSADELLKRSLQAQMDGNKDVRFVIKGLR